MMVHLALDALPRWRAGAELQSFAYVHLARSMDHLAQVYCQAMAGQLPAEPVLVVGQPTVFDPSRAPPGHHVLWVQVRVLPASPPASQCSCSAPNMLRVSSSSAAQLCSRRPPASCASTPQACTVRYWRASSVHSSASWPQT